MKKRILAFLVVLCMSLTFVLTGCSKNDDDGKKEKPQAPETPSGPSVDADAGRDEFIEGIGGVSDTYKGTVSKESYESANAAAKAFVSAEVVGTQKNAVIKSATSKGILSSDEILALNLPAEISAGVESVEKIEVEYSEVEAVALAAASSGTKKVIVYVIKTGLEYKYFSPAPKNGETITKSYYESVFNNDKYDNCTYVNESHVSYTASVGGQVMESAEMTLKQTIKRDGNKIYLKQEIVGDDMLIAQVAPGVNRYFECYIEEDGNDSTTTWVKQGASGTWQQGYFYNSVDPFAGQDKLDYAYFSKADFGFALKGENALLYYKQAATNASQIPDDAKLALYAEYYVNNGVLSGMRMEYSADMDIKSGGYTIKSITNGLNKMSCTDYGTTVVERPFAE